MIRRLAGLALLATLAAPPASACPPPSDMLLFHSCWGQGRLDILLLPEDLPIPDPAATGRRLIITGTYTGRENRAGGRPNPVGLFVHGGQVINPNLGRMDGVLIVDAGSGVPEVYDRGQVPLSGAEYDLRVLDQRQHFLEAAVKLGVSAMQSHLLIVEGEIDVRPRQDAPAFVRRLLFFDGDGFGVYQTRLPETLFDAATDLAENLSPRMVLNLDMGSFDYCRHALAGSEANCGRLGNGDTEKLSNLLVLTVR